jgi:monoterpene epsilon-lactone hydrolase
MPSLQSRFFNFIMRHSHVLHFRLKRRSWDFNTSIPRFRSECEKMARFLAKIPEGIEVLPVTVANLPAEWIQPSGTQDGPVIFYIHGGAFVSGSCLDHRMHVAKFVKGTGIRALLFEYRLAPEYPYPAALEDSVAAYRWLLAEGVSPSQIVIAGESAGGGLCLALLLALRDQGFPLPAAAVALSPLTDFKFTGESHRTKAKVCLSFPGMNTVCGKYYVGDNDPGLPWISPLYGDLHGLPPLLIYTGDDETLRDDSTRFAQKAKAAGVEVTLKIETGMVHCYPLLPSFIPEARQALAEICTFIKTRLSC